MLSDWTHLMPAHSFPEAIEVSASQPPVQLLAGSNDVCAVEAPFCAHVAALAVIVEGSPHEPAGDEHVHVPQSKGASRSAWPSKASEAASAGHCGASCFGPNHTSDP
jgi:hypothetical protein